MSTEPPSDRPDPFESDLAAGLSRIAENTEVGDPPVFDPGRSASLSRSALGRPRIGSLALAGAAALLVAVAGIVVVVVADDREALRSATPGTTESDDTDQLGEAQPAATDVEASTTSVATTTTVVDGDGDSDLTPADFAGVVPLRCFVETSGTGPANTVPLRIDLRDLPSPVEDTGLEMGPIDPGETDPRPLPNRTWTPVSSQDGSVILGYVYEPLGDNTSSPETLDPDCHPEVAIFDEQGVLIGAFVDGSPVIVDASDIPSVSEPPQIPVAPMLQQVAAAQREALRSLPGFTVTASVASTSPDAESTTNVVRYTLLADGSFYAETGPDTFGSYDPSTGIVLGAFRDLDGELTYQEIVGQSDNSVPLGVLGGYDPTMTIQPVVESSPIISEIEYNGRPAWRLEYRDTFTMDEEDDVTQETVQVVDRETGLIVSNSTSSSDTTTSTRVVQLTDIKIVDTMPPEFPGSFPADAEVLSDGNPNGAQTVELSDVAATFGPTVPLPVGFLETNAGVGSGPPRIVLTSTPSYLEGDDGRGDPSAEYLEATFTVREGFVATTVRISAQRLVGDAGIPPDSSVVDGFLCFDSEQDGLCDDFTTGDPNIETLEVGALSGRPMYIGEEATYTTGSVAIGGVNISVSGADREQTIRIFESFAF